MVLNGSLTGCSWSPQRLVFISLARKNRALTSSRCAAGKGFGQSTSKKPQEEGFGDLPSSKMKRVKSKGKQQRRLPQPSQAPAEPTMVQQGGVDSNADSTPPSLVAEMEFEERLKALKQEAEQKKQELKSADPAAGGILDAKRNRQDDIYADPPPLSQTLFGGEKKESDAEYEGSSFGPGQVALGAVSLALVGVFVLASGSGDFAPTRSSPSAQQQQQQGAAVDLTEDTRKELEARLEEFTAQLAESPGSSEALEGAAVVNARLGNYKEAVEQLQQLTAAKPGDPSVWRVLAESQAASGDHRAALTSYQRAWQEVKAAPGGVGAGLEVLQGLAGELVAAGQEQQAVEVVKDAQALLASPAGTGSSDSAGQQQQLGPVEAELLLAKVYSQWRGHTSEALAVYEQVTQSRPEDFRGFLGKGLLLRELGRQADAQRAFIQARYLAPTETRPVVDSIIASRSS